MRKLFTDVAFMNLPHQCTGKRTTSHISTASLNFWGLKIVSSLVLGFCKLSNTLFLSLCTHTHILRTCKIYAKYTYIKYMLNIYVEYVYEIYVKYIYIQCILDKCIWEIYSYSLSIHQCMLLCNVRLVNSHLSSSSYFRI